MEWSCLYEKEVTMFFMLSAKPNAVLKLLNQYGCSNTCAPKK